MGPTGRDCDYKAAEHLVRKLASLVEKMTVAIEKNYPDQDVRQAYKDLRDLKSRSAITADAFEACYDLFNELSDSLRTPQETRVAIVQRCLTLIKTFPENSGTNLASLVQRISEKTPALYVNPKQVLYEWSRQVFSAPVGYHAHILESRDQSVTGVVADSQELALLKTEDVMDGIRSALAQLAPEYSLSLERDIYNLTRALEKILAH